ncbi:MAG: Rne/Rng family ribonuclease [Rhodospirillales bacterium]|nr:Rne/Rng family ribonuclease [Rhodospirillales bacterium]
MTKRMLIDAGHCEETRVAVSDGRELQEFDVESAVKSQLKGNIYLAKVTRVEPSLQAAFVEYGGNRHGFLAFSEIHPDYFQIPVSDREELAAEQARLVEQASREDEEAAEADAPSSDDDDYAESSDDDDDDSRDSPEDEENDAAEVTAAADGEYAPEVDAEAAEATDDDDSASADDDEAPAEAFDCDTESSDDKAKAPSPARTEAPDRPDTRQRRRRSRRRNNEEEGDRTEAAMHSAILKRGYRIQEVIKRRQILLVQVVKEERGNKGAALTTYLSIAGRYCVLMPNTPRGGGISRKIADAKQRRRLKDVAIGLEVPQGMGLIIRTAGQGRTKLEIRRDFNSLLKQWEEIRSDTLQAMAPSLIYEEANIIKRAIRDLYAKDIDEVLVEGDEGYKMAKTYMKLLMPSHAARVKPYKEQTSLFHRYEVERQLDAMHSPVVQLKSGGYIVINLTEALVAIDVNSGRSTKERNIEETALKTNVEAAIEIARQLRLRDLAGLIVIDFIDMGEHRNERTVERKLKEAVKADRARIQIGRISGFGLMEMSRQRLRPSLQEALSEVCSHCGGTGYMRSTESTVLHVLRGIEDEALKGRAATIRVLVPTKVALYLLNEKRQMLVDIEERHGLSVGIERDDDLIAPDYKIHVETSAGRDSDEDETTTARDQRSDAHNRLSDSEAEGGKRSKNRRRRRKDRGDNDDAKVLTEDSSDESGDGESLNADADGEECERKRRRRGKRGGRRRRGRSDNDEATAENGETAEARSEDSVDTEATSQDNGDGDDAPKRRRRGRGKRDEATAEDASVDATADSDEDVAPESVVDPEAGSKSDAIEKPVAEAESVVVDGVTTTVVGADADEAASDTPSSPRRGWWQKIVGPN